VISCQNHIVRTGSLESNSTDLVTIDQPTHDTLRRTVHLDKQQYQAMIEDAALYMLDVRYPERYKDAITIRSRLNPSERKDHDAKLQFHAADLLDSRIGEKFWAAESEVHAQPSSRWPYSRVESVQSPRHMELS
jgi:hypothetical protein